jgi:hypothetical protein
MAFLGGLMRSMQAKWRAPRLFKKEHASKEIALEGARKPRARKEAVN